jgi:predicted RNase H-like HicB family nuclease
MTLKVIIQPGEDHGFIAHVPALKGVLVARQHAR